MDGFDIYTVADEDMKAKLPEWARSVLRHDDGTLFLPAVLGASEMEVLLCAGYDGTPVAQHKDHLFVPMDWLAREFPSDVLDSVCQKVKRSIENYDGRARGD